jgi:rubredoxin
MSAKVLKYKCEVCGYEYDENLGDSQSNISEGISFKNLPHGWRCPVCGADKDRFFEVKVSSL